MSVPKLEDGTLNILLRYLNPVEALREAYEWGYGEGYHLGATDEMRNTPEKHAPTKRRKEVIYADANSNDA